MLRSLRYAILPPVFCLAHACGPVGSGGTGAQPSESGGNPGTSTDGGGGSFDGNADSPSSQSDARAPGGYNVSGNTIYDANGQPHLFHGLDRPSLEWSSLGEHLSAQDYKLIASWKANVVRIALNQNFWLPASPSYDASYQQTVDEQVQWAKAAGLDVILDLHWSDRGNYGTAPGQQRMADPHSTEFWTSVATKYKSEGRVLFELYNEPHDISWEVWQNGGNSGDGFTAVGMQTLYDAVRATGAENLVLIAGVNWAYDLSGVPTHRIRGHNIVYVSHPYAEAPEKQPPYFDAKFGFLAATDPVMLTEFGERSQACNTSYTSQVLNYMDRPGQSRLSWTGWAWYPKDCSFPSLITDWAGTPSPLGVLVKQKLQSY